MLPKSIERGILEYFAGEDLLDFQIKKTHSVSGGDINSTALIESNEGVYFVKWNNANRFPGMFEKEAKGLSILRNVNEISLPKPLHFDEINEFGFLLMDAVIPGERKHGFWYQFGNQLAELHKHSNDFFGLDHDNYIGSLRQFNVICESWPDFFSTQRIEPQLQIARDKGRADRELVHHCEVLFHRFDALFPKEKPALLHGDLWSGNFMTGSRGEAVLIDPAVYFGHREMDLSMTLLFGGFDQDFYSGYHQCFPLENGWRQRAEIYNLYPLLVHLNLFGGGYLHQIRATINRFA